MINVERKFLTLKGEIIYFDVISDFAIQRGIAEKDFREISKLQPGTVTIMLKEEALLDEIIPKLINNPIDKLGVYLLNSALIFNNPNITLFNIPGGYNYRIIHINSQIVDVIFERSHKRPPISRLKPLIDLIYDE